MKEAAISCHLATPVQDSSSEQARNLLPFLTLPIYRIALLN